MAFKVVGDSLRQKPEVSTMPPACPSCGKPHKAGQCPNAQEARDVSADRRV